MEFLLLWVDELDDAVGTLRHLIPRILGFLFATIAFLGAALAFSLAPHAAFGIAAVGLSVSLFEVARRRRARQGARS